MDSKLYSMAEVCKLTGTKWYQISHVLRTGAIPQPTRIGRTLVFSQEELERIKLHFTSKGKGVA